MSEWLNKIISNYIKDDQTGFIWCRLMKDNIRKLIDIMEVLQKNDSLALVAFLDAEKALDCVEWPYLKQVLNKFGIGIYMEVWLNLIYNEQGALIVMEGYKSKPIIVE